jgi:hypothetical protein
MRARVSVTTLKRLTALERGKNAVRTLGAWPAILGWDEWEALAMVHQEKLCSDTREDAPVVTAENLPDPADVSHRYKPGGVRLGTRIRT